MAQKLGHAPIAEMTLAHAQAKGALNAATAPVRVQRMLDPILATSMGRFNSKPL